MAEIPNNTGGKCVNLALSQQIFFVSCSKILLFCDDPVDNWKKTKSICDVIKKYIFKHFNSQYVPVCLVIHKRQHKRIVLVSQFD